jgi:hypothetical protein
LLHAVGKKREVRFLEVRDDLPALLVINNGIDVDDLRRDADFFDVLRLGSSPGLGVSLGRLFFLSLEVGG